MRDRDRHQDEDGGSALTEQRHAGPAYEAHRCDDDGNDHQDDRNSSPDRAQHQYGNQQHDPERDGSEELKFLVHRVAHGTIEGELASNVVVDGRILCPRLGCGVVEVVDNLYPGQLSVIAIVGKRNTDNQPGYAAIPRNEAPGNFLGVERDFPNSSYVIVAQ